MKIFENEEREEKNWNKRGGGDDASSTGCQLLLSCMRLKFFHFAKSNRHRERDRPMDETTEAKKGKQTRVDGGGEQTESGILFASREKLIICRRAVTAESGPTISIRNIARRGFIS